MVEVLEPRQLLSADLTGAFVGKIPSALVLHGTNKVTVSVANAGDVAADGPVTVALYASLDATLDSNDVALTPTETKTVHLNTGKSTNIMMKFASPIGLANGSYFLLADITPGAGITDGNLANNVVATPATVSIHQAFVDLVGSIPSAVSGTIAVVAKHEKSGSITVVATNNGNVPAKGPFAITLYAATHQTLNSTDTLLLTKSFGVVTIANGKSKAFVVKYTPSASIPSGTFYILANVNSNNGIAESDTTNNFASSTGQVVIKNPAIAPGPFLAGALNSSFADVYVGEPKQDQFNVFVGRAGPGTVVNVDEFDASGNNLGVVATLLDDGNTASDGDVTANDGIYSGMASIDSTVAGTRYFAAVVIDPQLSAAQQSATITIVATPPPLPMLIGALSSDISTVVVGHPELARFSVQVANSEPTTTVAVEEFDASGNDLGTLVNLLDNGNPANDDAVAGDGIFTGVNTIAFTAPGTRYFAAIVSDPLLNTPLQTVTVAIPGIVTPSPTSLQVDITDNANLNQIAANVLAGGGTPQAAIGAVMTALQTDVNVLQGTIQTTPTSIEWQTTDGTYQGVSTDFLSTDGNLGGPASAPASVASTQSLTPADSTSGDPTQQTLILSPFASSLSQYDPSSTIDSLFTAANYTVTDHANGNVTFDDFKNLGQYDAVEIYSHGTQLANGGEGIYTSVQASVANSLANAWDLFNNRLVIMNGYYVITPNFITTYAGNMNGTIVEVNACSSLNDTQLGNAFIAQGAGAYLGYSNSVKAGFAQNKAILTWQTLLQPSNNTVGNIPGINVDHDTNTPAAVFTEDGPLSATLPMANLLKNYNVFVQYNWPQNVTDLDSNTTFLGASAGFNLDNSSPYLNWSGDNTGAGGSETTIVNISQAWTNMAWANSTTITAGADWYTPAGGSGPAYLTIGLQNKTTGALSHVTNETINPGQETEGAFDTDATIAVTLGGNPTNPTVAIKVT